MKPEFPKPRLIREDLMPEEDRLKNYRILKIENSHSQTVYHPQYKFLGLIWLYMNAHRTFYSFEDAVNYIRKDIISNTKPKVEYLELTEEDLKNSQKEPNPPLLEP